MPLPFCLVSTDWVFDGTQSGATEDTPPNPINLYGFLKAASEIVTLERGGAVARRVLHQDSTLFTGRRGGEMGHVALGVVGWGIGRSGVLG